MKTMKKWLQKRAREGSTYFGLGTLIVSLGTLFKADYVPELGEQVIQSADQLAAGDYAGFIATAILGGLTVLKADKGNK